MGGVAKPGSGSDYNRIAAHLTEVDTYDDACDQDNMTLFNGGQSFTTTSWPMTINQIDRLQPYSLESNEVDDFQDDHCGNLKTHPFEANEVAAAEWEVFPNPVNNMVQIRLPQEELPATVTMTDLQGRIVRSFQQTEVQTEADVRSLPAGMYILNANGKTTAFSQRITVQK